MPAVVVWDDGEIEAALINPLTAVAAVDWAASEALSIRGTTRVMKFNRLNLLPGAPGNLPLARLYG